MALTQIGTEKYHTVSEVDRKARLVFAPDNNPIRSLEISNFR